MFDTSLGSALASTFLTEFTSFNLGLLYFDSSLVIYKFQVHCTFSSIIYCLAVAYFDKFSIFWAVEICLCHEPILFVSQRPRKCQFIIARTTYCGQLETNYFQGNKGMAEFFMMLSFCSIVILVCLCCCRLVFVHIRSPVKSGNRSHSFPSP